MSVEVRAGYKQTEVGMIPEDWEVKSLGSLCEIAAGRDLVKEGFSSTNDHRHKFPIYSNALSGNGLYGYSKTYQYEPNKITVTARGDVGTAVYRNTRFCAIGRLLVLSSKLDCDLRYVAEFINNFVQFAVESTGVPQLTAPQISKYSVALPPTKAEQEAIAEALSDADALIESLAQLITKKRQIKQGAMQELLTGKRRLHGFANATIGYKQTEVGAIPEDWNQMPFIRAVGTYIDYRGRTPKKLGMSWGGGDILALSANNVQMGKIDPDKEAYFGSEELYKKWMVQGECEKGDVLLTMEAPLGNVAQIPDTGKYILSQRVLLIKPKGWLLRDFLAHYMKGSFFQNQLSLNSTGSTAKGIQRRKLDEVEVYFPPTKTEQKAIAEVFSDIDTEIATLETKLAKARQLKQGMMHNLLTGRIRLV